MEMMPCLEPYWPPLLGLRARGYATLDRLLRLVCERDMALN